MRIDVGCDDFGKAARNREMVAGKHNILAYLMTEAVLKGWPLAKPLPGWIPTGNLISVGEEEFRRMKGAFHELSFFEGVDVNDERYYTKDSRG